MGSCPDTDIDPEIQRRKFAHHCLNQSQLTSLQFHANIRTKNELVPDAYGNSVWKHSLLTFPNFLFSLASNSLSRALCKHLAPSSNMAHCKN